MSRTIEVATVTRQQYSCRVGKGLESELLSFCATHFSADKVVIIIDERVNDLHGNRIGEQCQSYFNTVEKLVVPEGEQSKSIIQWNKLLDELLKRGVERATPVLAAGGGVTGDLAGFVAASALRGIPLIHLPTTLLAMVDSSIGGKTGINHATGKNLIGAFYQPKAVFADVNFLETLHRREWVNGLSEVIKYAAISDPGLFDLIDRCIESGFSPSRSWIELIHKSAAIKADIVQQDILESGIREYLNFGHTFAHAIEKNAGYGTISHGEAVLIGMIAGLYLSQKLGGDVNPAKIEHYLELHSIHLDDSAQDLETLVQHMRKDKKVKQAEIRLVLLKKWGKPYIYNCKDENLLCEAWDFAFDKIKI